MNDATANKYVETYFSRIVDSRDDEQRKRFLRLLVKDVERDTRHKAVDVVQKALNEIHNLQHE